MDPARGTSPQQAPQSGPEPISEAAGEPGSVGPTQGESGWVGPTQGESGWVGPTQGESGSVGPTQRESGWVGPTQGESGWVGPTHRALVDAGITVVGHVPDGGLSLLIARLEADDRLTVVHLTSEEEGVALLAGVWLGGGRAALLMQSSGVGNCTNMLSLLATCRVPGFLLVTMRGQQGESNPWQLPMGRAAGDSMALMGVDVRRASSSDAVAAAVTRACADGFGARRTTAVLIDQQVIGIKRFRGDEGEGR